jgi:hypothetical protein
MKNSTQLKTTTHAVGSTAAAVRRIAGTTVSDTFGAMK